jgi:flavin reductase (DIM6/NTAB) family NADH-FMN oxidoreductase RutF
MHKITDPAILYFGTPVVLISTLNPDGRPNLAPMSSAWWLGHHAMLGLSASSMTTQNLLRERPIQLEATLVDSHPFASFAQALEVRIERVHADESLLAAPIASTRTGGVRSS